MVFTLDELKTKISPIAEKYGLKSPVLAGEKNCGMLCMDWNGTTTAVNSGGCGTVQTDGCWVE